MHSVLGLRHTESHTAYGAPVVDRDVHDVIGIRLGRRRHGQQPDYPDRTAKDRYPDRDRDHHGEHGCLRADALDDGGVRHSPALAHRL